MSNKLWIALVATIVIVGAIVMSLQRPGTSAPKLNVTDPGSLRYLPLGDSYTIGQSVAEQERWPNQLVAKLAADGTKLVIIANPAVTGYTSQNLIDSELPLVAQLKPDFVTIQIGVNDYVQGVSSSDFAANLDNIIRAVQSKLTKPENILLVTIPDYGKTPTGAQYGSPASSEAAIISFNLIITDAARRYHLPVADIFAVSQRVLDDPSLIAPDGLHPSGKQYADWTSIIYATMQANHLPL
ncbi:MAG: SGNH/GDSL hydrolase family protein [Candidatus Saccharimonadales bacterium]